MTAVDTTDLRKVEAAISPATIALVPPPPAAPIAEPTVAPPVPPDAAAVASDDGEISGYWTDVRGSIIRHLKYPRLPAGTQANTNILLRITIDSTGRLVEAVAENSKPSPYSLAAQRAVERSAPFAPPGADVPRIVELPVRFERAE